VSSEWWKPEFVVPPSGGADQKPPKGETTSPPLTTHYSPAQLLLGLFITWQLVFLFLANFLPFVPHGHEEFDELIDDVNLHGRATTIEPVQQAIEDVAWVSDRWMEATGQLQGWSLFAPSFPPQAGFVAVRFGWSDGSQEVVKSRFERNPMRYCRPPGTHGRLFNYESRFIILPAYWPEARLGASWWPWEMEWREAITHRVQMQWKSMRAYLRWRRDQYLKGHPESPPPTEAVLMIDLYLTPGPREQPWAPKGPFVRALARWRPDVQPPAGRLPIEVCVDPGKETFEWISERGE
jgi:hypothetical protein